MSKKSKVETVVENPVVVASIPAATVEVKDGRGAKKGVPHITDKVLQMDEAGREKWLTEKCGTEEIKTEVRNRLNDILKNGRTATTKGKTIDYASLFAGRDYDELVAAMGVLNVAIENSKVEAAKRLEEIIAKAEQEKLRLQEKFGVKA
jgi:sulfite reductase beta subunit-like hemoprotein